MKSAFECAGKTLEGGILIVATFVEGKCGTITIYRFESIEPEEGGDNTRVFFTLGGNNKRGGCQEPLDMDGEYRMEEPFNRSGVLYLGYGFGDLDVIPTSDGSRFLSLKSTLSNNSLVSSADDYPDTEVAVIFDDEGALPGYLEELLPRLGVPEGDITVVTGDILTKIA